ncbi:hypothetical protein BDA96_10G220900 [Sorghum bicolor]|uniref:Uncharacterized protein n=1 Tax=Sorghum bicolor TaxID=4558 RepID=A0A921Q3U5_SORBI|nr:hypothetical protein BDA96_10G220900 [Sorghum bicolor]
MECKNCGIQGGQHSLKFAACWGMWLMILSVCLVFCGLLLSKFFCWESACVFLFLVCVLHALRTFYFWFFYLTSGKLPPILDIYISC